MPPSKSSIEQQYIRNINFRTNELPMTKGAIFSEFFHFLQNQETDHHLKFVMITPAIKPNSKAHKNVDKKRKTITIAPLLIPYSPAISKLQKRITKYIMHSNKELAKQ